MRYLTDKPIEKFQSLLRKMFQFDSADLDFGIYRIMNHKRHTIEKFIQETLPGMVEAELDLEHKQKVAADMEKAVQKVKNTLGSDAIDFDGELAPEYRHMPVGEQYLEAKKLAEASKDPDALEADIYNHLYSFFNRYYQDGDFISKPRYSKRQQYVVPYNGEEVYLHWANKDQYYIKTTEHFYNYESKIGNIKVRFEVSNADVEHDNVKGDKRFFIPLTEKIQLDGTKLLILFEYRPLTQSEAKKHKRQDQIISHTVNEIFDRLIKISPNVAVVLSKPYNDTYSQLERHLKRYTRRNTSDFFIHKDLKGFLSRELDFYLKNEVLNLDEIERAGELNAPDWFQMMHLVKSIGSNIIDFLAQIEEFQKTLWEKRKFVAETNYCIAVEVITPKYYPTIAGNVDQWAEWQRLLCIGRVNSKVDFMKKHPGLIVDTRHFDRDFVDRLLGDFDDLDAFTDGLLVHSENWQALRLLNIKYRQSIKCIYIDPPYNAPSSEIVYRNGYKHSSYLSMMFDRISLSRSLMTDDTVHILAIDENEQERIGLLLKTIFESMNHTTISIIANPTGQQSQNISYSHDYACFGYKNEGRQIGKEIRKIPIENNFRDWGGEESKREMAKNCFYPIYVKNGIVVGFGDVCSSDYHPRHKNMSDQCDTIAIYPIDNNGVERKWRFERNTVDGITNELLPYFIESRKEWDIKRSKNVFNFKTVWTDSKYSANNHGTQLLNHILGSKLFDYPKSINTVVDCLRAGLNTQSRSITIDYFAGSGTTGHAIINLNREDGGRRKFILVEMGEYFDTVLLPRIKKVAYIPEWKDGRPKRVATEEEARRGPRIVKYMRLESYEDALDNIEFGGPELDRFDDYLLKYMLKWETKGSATLLNVKKLTSPFSYTLRLRMDGETKVRTVDIPETFNYLLGLHVHSRRAHNDDGRYYLVYRGETRDAPDKTVCIIWRDTKDWRKRDFKRDRAFVEEQGVTTGADHIYVNGDSVIPNAKPVEPMFRDRMFAKVGV